MNTLDLSLPQTINTEFNVSSKDLSSGKSNSVFVVSGGKGITYNSIFSCALDCTTYTGNVS